MIEEQLSKENLLLSVVVVSYNTAQITLDCLNALINEINFSPNLVNKTEILVVDNASHDQSVPAIENLIVKNNLEQSF
ncbi:MAG TPA: glycosyltransferase, partial [Candidatus Woesebacteria bacterium]|nr:glycosyltransferase [Candidatus Woesebacteria bacterium]